MKVVGQQSALARQLEAAARENDAERQSPQQNASATSGTYFRVPRPAEQEATPLVQGEPIVDRAKVEGLRFELDVGVWRADPERIARRILIDAEHAPETGDDEE